MQYWDKRPKALQLVGRSVESVRQIVISTPLLLPAAIAAYVLITIGLIQLSNLFPVSAAQELEFGQIIHSQSYANVLPLRILQLAAELPVAVIVSVPNIIIIRHILLEETGFRWPPLFILWPYAAWNFAQGTLALVSGQFQYFFPDIWGVYLISIVVSLTFAVLSSLLFPGIAIGVHYDGVSDRMRHGLQHLRGNSWLLLRAYLIIFIAAGAAMYLPYLPGFLFSDNPLEITPTNWMAVSFDAAITVTMGCIAAGVVGWLYAWVAPPRFLENFD